MAAASKVTSAVVTAMALAAVAGCSTAPHRTPGRSAAKGRAAPPVKAQQVRVIGDGSTAYTGAQPNQPVPVRLKPGEKPPQFVVFSWDGAGEDGQKLFSHFRAVGKKYDATMTYFLSGVYMLPTDERELYRPPQHSPGASDIGFNDVKGIRATVRQMRGAWRDGNEIGTHFNGHFCGPDGGVGTWSTEEWKSEIEQAESFVQHWRTTSGLTDEKPLPFDYAKELVGGRAPCLEGQKNLIPAAKESGFRYDASSAGGLQVWPRKIDGVWDFPLQQIPVPGRTFETLSMDYNFLANQSVTTEGDPAMRASWGRQMHDGLIQAFNRAYQGNRAPLFIGDHFESWNGGVYMKAVEDTIKAVCPRKGVRCVSFKQLADWLDAQDPEVLGKLRGLEVGQAPQAGWASYLAGSPAAPAGAAVSGAAGPASADAEGRVKRAAE
ncbi:hypothetical protein [Streptomyces pinistramenti]|uniref:hypothetical protein n=1 Tax=Streptomyces pinistramenti TaxID=2884812 RepID=UPI001D06C3E1|nr:hypothetical protein [Streptomyces pinistramenti]MCB5910947.1 hypothetical protein [Streptomyces pinistramenti]